jgi:hypothetical protein
MSASLESQAVPGGLPRSGQLHRDRVSLGMIKD